MKVMLAGPYTNVECQSQVHCPTLPLLEWYTQHFVLHNL